MKKTIIISALIILTGYVFKDKTFYINLGDTYYVTSYLFIAVFLACLILMIYCLKILLKKEN